MQSLNEEERRRIVVQYLINHPDSSKSSIIKYFQELGIARSTINGIIDRYLEIGAEAAQRECGSGCSRSEVKVTSAEKTRIANDARKGLSQREIARKYNISQPYVNKILQEQGLTAYKKEKVPSVTPQQQERQRCRIDRLYRSLLATDSGNPDLVIDDEAYFPLLCSSVPGNRYYYATARGDAPDAIRQSPQKKFESKVLIWLAISRKGISRAFICHAGTMNKDVYIKECIRRRLIPFINMHHSDGDYLFWPDLASCHYAKDTVATFEEEGINFVAKECNPPCVPQLRPIEDFWGMLKQKVYHRNWQAQTLDQLENRICSCLRQMDSTVVHGMMEGVKSRIRVARAHGVGSVHH